MNIGFFDIVFMCNSQTSCDGVIPSELWRTVTCFDNLIKYVNEWREYQNEQATKQ